MRQAIDYNATRESKKKKAKLIGMLFSIQVLINLAVIFIIAKMVVEKITGA